MPDYRAMARQAAVKYGIDPNIFERQIQQESGFDPNAKSPAGAVGIAQIMPQFHPGVNPLDPEASLEYAAKLMAGYVKKYGNYVVALAAYNAGPGNVEQYGGKVPPFPETQDYIKKITGGGLPAHKEDNVPDPDKVIRSDTFWSHPDKKDAKTGELLRLDKPVRDWRGEIDSRNIKYYEVVYEDGRTEVSIDGGPMEPGEPDQVQWTRWKYAQERADKAAAPPPSQATQWSIQIQQDGTKVAVNEVTQEVRSLEGFGPTVEGFIYKDPNTGAETYKDKRTGKTLFELSPGPEDWIPGVGVQAPQRLAPRYPEEAQQAQLGVQETQLDIQKKKQDMNKLLSIIQQMDEGIKAIGEQYRTGSIGLDEANKMTDLLRENGKAALKGTTPHQIEQNRITNEQKQKELTQTRLNDQATLARGMFGDRQQNLGTLTQGLMSGLGQIYSKVYSSTNPPYIDPAQYAGEIMGQADDSEMSQLAKAVLMGALQGGQQ